MAAGDDAQAAGERVEALLAELRSQAGPQVAATAEELVGCLVELYGAGLARITEILGDDESGPKLMDKLVADGLDPGDISLFVHGTTVATNALLEGKGARTGLMITRGFRAVYEARGWSQPRGSDLIDTFYRKPPLLASQWLTEEVTERLDYRGEVVTPLDEAALRAALENGTVGGAPVTAGSWQSPKVAGTGTGVPARAEVTRCSRPMSWAEGSTPCRGGRRSTQLVPAASVTW